MLELTVSWDWFHEDLTPEEKEAIAQGRLVAVLSEDGDHEAAITEAVKSVDAPVENTRLITIDPMIGDCFLAIAWDDRSVDCTETTGST